MTPGYLELVADAVRRKYRCVVRHLKTLRVTEKFHDRIVWDGNVEVFTLRGYEQATRAFAWCHEDDEDCVVYPQSDRIFTPVDAVRAHIIEDFNKRLQ